MNAIETATCRSPDATTLLVIATYNELENLPVLVERIHAALPDADILVIDDNSPDGTGRWCDDRVTFDARLRCLHRPAKLGLGTATILGLRYAVLQGYQFVFTMDADLSHDTNELAGMLARLQADDSSGADVVIGSRYVPGGRIAGWSWKRRWMSRWVNRFARWWLHLPVRDASGAFRGYRTEALRQIDLEGVRAKGYSVFEELLWLLHRKNVRFVEWPITFIDRRHGQSKISLKEAVTSMWHMARLPWQS